MLKKAEFKADFRIILPDGTVKNLHTIGHPILSESGDILEFVGTAIDITERKRAEEALRQAQADLAHVSRVTSMGELTTSLAHEVNQPIAAAVTDANTCLRWLARDQPDLERRAKPRREWSKTQPVRRKSSSGCICSSRRVPQNGSLSM
jgi:signal transduction histidine kinase